MAWIQLVEVGQSSAHAWVGAGKACTQAPMSLFSSSSGRSAPPAQQGPALPSAPKQKLPKGRDLGLVRSEIVQIRGCAWICPALPQSSASPTAVEHVRFAYCEARRDDPELAPSYSLQAFPAERE